MQSSSAIPTGTSSSSTRNSKLDQIIQNFYTKCAQVIVQARCTPNNDLRYGKGSSLKGSSTTSSSRKMNKWFNIATEDTEVLREDLKYWRNLAIQPDRHEPPPPLILDIYLDTTKLSHNQTLVITDDNLRWSCVELKSQTSDAHIDRILIESWELTLNHPFPDYAVDLPNLYKRSIVFFRALHSFVRLLPCYDMYRKLHKDSSSTPLSIGYRLSSYPVHKNTEISIDSTILENDARKPTMTYDFSNIVTPMGTFKLHSTYRRNCDFRVEDSERDLSAQFIDMDEQFFTPTMAKYQQQQQQDHIRPRPVSMYSPRHQERSPPIDSKLGLMKVKEARFSPSVLPSSSDSKEIGSKTTPSSSVRPQLASSPASNSSKPDLASRRASAPYVVSPFKSPFLSSSQQAESIFSGAGSGSSKHYTPPNTTTHRASMDQSTSSFGRKIEFSSSFDKYKNSPRNDSHSNNSSIMMNRRWSRASDHSSILKSENDDDDDLEDFVRFVGSNQGLFQNKNTSMQSLSYGSPEETGMLKSSIGKQGALSHFQNLRETHNSLSESLSSSMMIGNTGGSSHQDPVSGISPVSSTSSTGRSYQPVIPSPLHHTEQRSTSPVHIPRSYPQLLSSLSQNNALRSNRMNPSSPHEDDINSAYSTYPQDHHHQDLHLLRNANTTDNSTRNTGKAIPYGNNNNTTKNTTSSMLDDDDSLVFRMSELECEGSTFATTTPQQQIKFNNNVPTTNNNRFLELTPTALSPPLLHRLQAISMSTVNEEEERNNSSSSSSTSSPTVKPPTSKPSQLHFDTW